MFQQLGNLIINSTIHYIIFYVCAFILGINNYKQLHIIGTIGFILGSTHSFNER
jgi:hypothetical protein